MSSGWPISVERYLRICADLGFLGADHPIVVTQMGTIDQNDDADLDSEEVRRLYWSCIDNGYKPAKRLRIIAVGYRGERGR